MAIVVKGRGRAGGDVRKLCLGLGLFLPTGDPGTQGIPVPLHLIPVTRGKGAIKWRIVTEREGKGRGKGSKAAARGVGWWMRGNECDKRESGGYRDDKHTNSLIIEREVTLMEGGR